MTGWLRVSIWLVSSVKATSIEESESENVVSKATKQEKHRWLKTGTNWSGTPCSGTRLCSCVGVWVVMERGQKWEDDICPHRVKDDHSLTSIQASRFPLLCVLATSGAFPTAIISNSWHPYCNGNANSVITQHTRRIWIAGYNSSNTWLENSVASRHSHTTWGVGTVCWMACSLRGTRINSLTHAILLFILHREPTHFSQANFLREWNVNSVNYKKKNEEQGGPTN